MYLLRFEVYQTEDDSQRKKKNLKNDLILGIHQTTFLLIDNHYQNVDVQFHVQDDFLGNLSQNGLLIDNPQ